MSAQCWMHYADTGKRCERAAAYELEAEGGPTVLMCADCARDAEQAIRNGEYRIWGRSGVPVVLRSLALADGL